MTDDRDVRTPQDSFQDKIGQEVRVGDTIAYGRGLDSSGHLRLGKVKAIVKVDPYYGRARWAITVQGVDDDYGGEPTLTRRLGTLQFPDRTLKITAPLPPQYEALLRDV